MKKALNKGLLLYAYPKIDGDDERGKYKRREAVWKGDRMGFGRCGIMPYLGGHVSPERASHNSPGR